MHLKQLVCRVAVGWCGALLSFGATNNVIPYSFTVQHAAASPLTNEVVFTSGGTTGARVVFGYDLDAKKTNWVYQPRGNPDLVTFSIDGGYLFIGLPGSNGVLQVDAPTRTPIRLIASGVVTALRPIPGEPESIVTWRSQSGLPGTIAIYDAGVKRTNVINSAYFETLYAGKVYYQTDKLIGVASIDADGLKTELSTAAVWTALAGPSFATEKYLIDGAGGVRDRATLALLGQLPFGQDFGSMMIECVDEDRLLCTMTTTSYQVQAFRLSNLQFTGSFRASVAPLLAPPMEFLRLATNRVLLIANGRPSLIEPMAIAAIRADVGVSVVDSVEPALIGGDETVTITVTNRGPANATGVGLTNRLTGGETFVGFSSSQGTITGGYVSMAKLGDIPAGGSATVTLRLKAGMIPTTGDVIVGANEADPDVTDNTASFSTQVTDGVELAKARDRFVTVNALAFANQSKKLYATTDATQGKLGNAILRIDPATGIVEQTNVIGISLGKLELSLDEQFAFVNGVASSNLARVNLATGETDWQIVPSTIQDILRPAGEAELVVVTAAGIYVYDDLVPRPEAQLGYGHGTVGVGPGQVFFTRTGTPLNPGLASIDANGLTPVRTYQAVDYSLFGSLEIYGRRVFGSYGAVFDLDSGVVTRTSDLGLGSMSVARGDHKVFYAPNSGSTLRVFDADTQTEVSQIAWPYLLSPTHFATGDGFAAAGSQGGRLKILESTVFSDHGEEDLSVKIEALDPALVGNEMRFRVVVDNKLAASASNLTATINFSTNLMPLRFDIGRAGQTNGFSVVAAWGELAGGESITGVVTVLPLRAGVFQSAANIAGLKRDSAPDDNVASVTTAVHILPQTDTRIELEGNFGNLVRNPRTGTFISCPPQMPPTNGPVEIDPMTGTITPLDIPLPYCPLLAISDDGNTLYGLLEDRATVALIDIPSRQEIGRVALDGIGYKLLAIPGTQNAFVVAVSGKTVIYDGMTARPMTAINFYDIAVSEDGKKLYGASSHASTRDCMRFSIEPGGLAPDAVATCFRTTYDQMNIRTEKGLIFTSLGQVGDVGRNKVVLDFFERDPSLLPFVPDLGVGRIYRVSGGVAIIDAQTGQQLGYYDFLSRPHDRVERFGPDGLLAYSGPGFGLHDSILLIRSSLIGSQPDADVGILLQQRSVSNDRVEYSIELRNESSTNAANAQAHLILPAGVEILSAPDGSTQGTNEVFLPRRRLAAGERFLQVVAVKPIATPYIARAQAITDARDAVTWNNWDATLTSANFIYTLEETKSLPIPAADMVALPNGKLCVITTSAVGPGLEDRMITIDPTAGTIVGAKAFLGFRPNKLAVSDDGTYAYASTWPAGAIYRVNLESNAIDQTSEVVGAQYVFDMTVVPGSTHSKQLLATAIPYGQPTPDNQRCYFIDDGTTAHSSDGILYLSTGAGLVGSGSAGVWQLASDGSLAVRIGDFGGYADLIADNAGHVFAENGTEYMPYRAIATGSLAFDPIWNDRVYVLWREGALASYRIDAFRRDDFSPFDVVQARGPLEYPYTVDNLVRFGMGGLAFTTDTQIKLVRSAVVPIATGVDTDGDGLDDAYEWKYGLDPTVADADEDLDGDGVSNRDEFLGGTAPNDPESVFKIQLTHIDGTPFQFTFSFVQDRRYQVLRRDRLDAGAWEIVQDDFSPVTGFPVIDIGAGNAFYTVKVLP